MERLFIVETDFLWPTAGGSSGGDGREGRGSATEERRCMVRVGQKRAGSG